MYPPLTTVLCAGQGRGGGGASERKKAARQETKENGGAEARKKFPGAAAKSPRVRTVRQAARARMGARFRQGGSGVWGRSSSGEGRAQSLNE